MSDEKYQAFIRSKVKMAETWGFELSSAYFLDGAAYCRAASEEMSMPALFDLDALDNAKAEAA